MKRSKTVKKQNIENGRITDWNENSGFIQTLNGDSVFFHKSDLVDKDLQLRENVTFKWSKSTVEKHIGTKVAINIQRKGNKVNLLDYKRFIGVLISWDGKHGFIKSSKESKLIEFYFSKRLFLNDSFEKGNLVVFCPVTEHTNKLSGFALFAYNIAREKGVEFLQKQFIKTGNKAISEYINTIVASEKLSFNKKLDTTDIVKSNKIQNDDKTYKAQEIEILKPLIVEDISNLSNNENLEHITAKNPTESRHIDNAVIIKSTEKLIKESTEELFEGVKKTVTVNSYERNPKARQLCVKYWKAICAVCEIDFEKTYGKIGKGFIHVHHLTPVSLIGETYQVDPINDLIPVCPNCHSMLHKCEPPLTIEELKMKMKQQ